MFGLQHFLHPALDSKYCTVAPVREIVPLLGDGGSSFAGDGEHHRQADLLVGVAARSTGGMQCRGGCAGRHFPRYRKVLKVTALPYFTTGIICRRLYKVPFNISEFETTSH